jgi:hypothetical protein
VAFDVASESAALLPTRLLHFGARAAAVRVPGEGAVYVIGGGLPGLVYDQVQRFDPASGALTLSDVALVEGRFGEVAVYVPQETAAYLFGGTAANFQLPFNIAALQFGYPPSATAQSIKVSQPGEQIREALLTVQQDLQGGSVSYSLSNNGGQTWARVYPAVKHVFAAVGSDLRWRAVLSGTGPSTPIVDSLTIAYNGIERYQLYLPVLLKL